MAYGLQNRELESTFLVIDLGGGTFDVSVLELFDGVMEVHATAGDNFLGGEDFVDLLVQACLQDHSRSIGQLKPVELAQLRGRIEQAKCGLSQADSAAVSLPWSGDGPPWCITAERFQTLAQPLVARMRAPVERALRDARITPDKLNEIILVGGASRMPLVAKLVAQVFRRLPLRHINPDQAIATGAAVMAGLKARDAALREVVMTDVSPYSLGIGAVETRDGEVEPTLSPIIERNTPVPVSRVRRYQPLRDFQADLVVDVYQGESLRLDRNHHLGTLCVPLPRDHANAMPVDVRFTYDVNGLLEVEACVVATGSKYNLVILRSATAMSDAEIAERLTRLAALKVHPRDDQANLAVLSRAERLFEERIGAVREELASRIHRFSQELETQDLARIAHARDSLLQFLASLESGGLDF